MAEKTVNLGIRGTPDRRRALRQIALDTGKSVQRLVDEALTKVYFSQTDDPAMPNIGDPIRNRTVIQTLPTVRKPKTEAPGCAKDACHEALDEILSSDHDVAKEAITRNLVAFRELVERAANERAADPDAGKEHLSDDEMEALHARVPDYEQALSLEEKNLPGSKTGGGRRRKTPRRTGDSR